MPNRNFAKVLLIFSSAAVVADSYTADSREVLRTKRILTCQWTVYNISFAWVQRRRDSGNPGFLRFFFENGIPF